MKTACAWRAGLLVALTMFIAAPSTVTAQEGGNSALAFDSADDALEVGMDQLRDSSMTIELWARRDSNGSWVLGVSEVVRARS